MKNRFHVEVVSTGQMLDNLSLKEWQEGKIKEWQEQSICLLIN